MEQSDIIEKAKKYLPDPYKYKEEKVIIPVSSILVTAYPTVTSKQLASYEVTFIKFYRFPKVSWIYDSFTTNKL